MFRPDGKSPEQWQREVTKGIQDQQRKASKVTNLVYPGTSNGGIAQASGTVTGYVGSGGLTLHLLEPSALGVWLCLAAVQISDVVDPSFDGFYRVTLNGATGRFGDTDVYGGAAPGSGSDSDPHQLNVLFPAGPGAGFTLAFEGGFPCTSSRIDWSMIASHQSDATL